MLLLSKRITPSVLIVGLAAMLGLALPTAHSQQKAAGLIQPVVEPDPAVEAWIRPLAKRITDPHDAIRESARAALVAVGPMALPTLRRLAKSEDPAEAFAARKVIQTIEVEARADPSESSTNEYEVADEGGQIHGNFFVTGNGNVFNLGGPNGNGNRTKYRTAPPHVYADKSKVQAIMPMPMAKQ